MSDHELRGRKQIRDYVGRGWGTILAWRDCMGFPLTKLGDCWVSDKGLIDEWRREQIRKQKGGEDPP